MKSILVPKCPCDNRTDYVYKQKKININMKNWEVTIKEFQSKSGKKYKVTRRLLEIKVAETKMFTNKEEALKQFNEWLNS